MNYDMSKAVNFTKSSVCPPCVTRLASTYLLLSIYIYIYIVHSFKFIFLFDPDHTCETASQGKSERGRKGAGTTMGMEHMTP